VPLAGYSEGFRTMAPWSPAPPLSCRPGAVSDGRADGVLQICGRGTGLGQRRTARGDRDETVDQRTGHSHRRFSSQIESPGRRGLSIDLCPMTGTENQWISINEDADT